MKNTKIGFIGQGWVGKHYADDFERRGYYTVRYALEKPYNKNKEKIATCDIVFIAVPTPTTPKGFDDSIVRQAVGLVGNGKIAVIKSTVLPGTTESIQKEHSDKAVLHSPEFLREASAAYDASHPERNIVGYQKGHKKAAHKVLTVLPRAPYQKVMPVRNAELVKYAGNVFLYMKVIYANLLYDVANACNIDYETVKDAVAADSRIGPSHLNPLHYSGHVMPSGAVAVCRGAGGHCFIKDFAAFSRLHEAIVSDERATALLRAFEEKNKALLKESSKDIDLLDGVYGPCT